MRSDYTVDEVRRALEFIEALGELCETHGFYLDSHCPMYVESVGAQTDGSADLEQLFGVKYRDGYSLDRHYN